MDYLTSLKAAHPSSAKDIDRVVDLAGVVWDALQGPGAPGRFAEAWGDLEFARLTLLPSSQPDAMGYAEAARLLARQRGYDVIEIRTGPGPNQATLTSTRGGPPEILDTDSEGFVRDEDFMNEVVGSGQMIIDWAALDLGQADHGALSHFLQDLVVDEVLEGEGSSAVEFRSLLKSVSGLPRQDLTVPAGTDVWMETFDVQAGFAEPETFWPAIRDLLNIPVGAL